MPLALCIPPQIFLAHLQLTELYMAWLHTELVDTIGPLELILNTPSHHRVHHSRNPEYIDKNYGAMLIIWDRLFKTFKKEDKQNNPPVYGLVHPVASYEPFYVQFHTWPTLWERLKEVKSLGLMCQLKIIFYNPGWAPGLRYGESLPVPAIKRPISVYDPKIGNWKNLYVVIHFALMIFFYHELTLYQAQYSASMINIGVISLLASITTLGLILDNRSRYNSLYELIRCVLFFQASKPIMFIMDHGLKRIGLHIYHRLMVISTIDGIFIVSLILNSTILAWNLMKLYETKFKSKSSQTRVKSS